MRTREFYIIWIACLLISLIFQPNTDHMLIGIGCTYTAYLLFKGVELFQIKRKKDVAFFKYKYASLIKLRDHIIIPGFFYTVAFLVFFLFDVSLKTSIITSTILPIAPYVLFWLTRLIFATSIYGVFLYPDSIQFGFGEKKIPLRAVHHVENGTESISFFTENKIHTHKFTKEDIDVLIERFGKVGS